MSAVTQDRVVPKVPWIYDPRIRSLAVQLLLVGIIVWLCIEIVSNAAQNLTKLNQNFGWSFLWITAGFDIIQRPIAYLNTSTYGRALFIGFVNTVIVAVLGIIAATLLGFLIGIMRLSRNFVIKGVATAYVETIRNIPLLLQIVIWYATVLKPLPGPRQAFAVGLPLPSYGFPIFVPVMVLAIYGYIQVYRRIMNGMVRLAATVALFVLYAFVSDITAVKFGPVFSVYSLGGWLSNRGLILPRPLFGPGAIAIPLALLFGLLAAFLVRRWARARQEKTGRQFPSGWASFGLIVGLPLIAAILAGWPISFEYPELKGFNFAGGLTVIPEFLALFFALSIYTSTFIAETVRAGILAVSHGQTEAALSLGLRQGHTLRLVVIPQAMRVIIPPLTSQYLNLTKNSSLAVAIAYPDLVAVGGTILNQTGKAIEIISIWMAVYLSLSLFTSALMNWYNARVRLVER